MAAVTGLDTAIRNVGDYYAAHYLADKNGFAKDIADKTKAWKAQGAQSVARKLQALGEAYFKAKTQALDYSDPALRQQSPNKELRGWHHQLLAALGYQPEPFALELESEQKQVPALLRLNRHSQPWLVICETPFCLNDGDNDEEPLEQDIIPPGQNIEGLPTLQADWEKAVALIFKQEDRPRWAMLLSGSRIYLFDAHTYAQGRYLYVDLDDAFGRKAPATFEAICALLAKEALAPSGETDDVLHERLREGSLKSTHGVSEKLQAAVRTAIEAIANGWVDARREARMGFRKLSESEPPLPYGSRDVMPEQLRHDALIYVYRLLFCLYAEARGQELNILPISDPVYKQGYSLEALRDLVEQVEPGTSTENGTYYAEHLNRLFDLIHSGFHPEANSQTSAQEHTSWADFARLPEQSGLFDAPAQGKLGTSAPSRSTTLKTFTIQPLTATLFAPNTTPLLNRVKLPNRVLHQVIRCLSLGTGDKGKRIGRINYAELGILQLGAVYEGLLSYKGFFAKENLIQVLQKPKGTKGKPQPVVLDNAIDPKTPTWFVPESRAPEFKTGEIVLEHRTKQPRIYKTGEFILHLNGVDRVNSASYYTPEVLTRCLISEALKERLKDFGPQQADDILKLTICEPAMGSAAFLVEAIDQLGRHYLRLKQQQTGKTIDPSQYEDELRRVRHYIAVHNVYGVDLNPTAVELGALSLWLSTIHRLKIADGDNGTPDQYQPGATPWFGLRLRAGNSLVGARRAVWTEQQLVTGEFYGTDAAAPRQLKPGEQRKKGEIYHFLVWDEDMTPAARDSLMRQYWGEECKTINQWRNQQVKKQWLPEDIARAREICTRIDTLWQDYAEHRIKGLKETECTATVWPTPAHSIDATKPSPSLAFQESRKAKLEAQSGAFQRLKLLMDSWCSFYYWPIQAHDQLPSREAWLAAAEVLLGCASVQEETTRAMLDIALGDQIDLEALFQASQQKLPDAAKLAEAVPWFGQARAVDSEQHFHHWELIFTEVLGPQIEATQPRGFDLMFGNPPWMKVTWNDAPLLSEFEPLLGVRDAKSAKYNSERPKLLEQSAARQVTYREAFAAAEGSSVFLNDRTLYPALAGVQTNLYKNFIERSWGLLFGEGVAGLLHPEGVFDDPRGGEFRAEYYKRLLAHYQLKNERILFADVHHVMAFSINIYCGFGESVDFKSIFNLFSPNAIEQSHKLSDGHPEIPGIKNSEGEWETRGHPQRIIQVTETELALFAKLFEDDNTPPIHARLPQVHSQPLLKVLEKFAQAPRKLRDLKGQYLATEMFHEANAQRDGIITRMEEPTFQPQSADEWVLSGPHFFVGNPFNKTPRTTCTANGHYDAIDLEAIPEDYLPRAVYRPGDKHGNLDKFYAAIPEWPKPRKPVQDDTGQWHGGFWPVADDEVPAWEALLGEPLKRYGIDPTLPGAKTARQFGYFSRWQGEVEDAIAWLKANEKKRDSEAFNNRYMDVRVRQAKPGEQMKHLPVPVVYPTKYGLRAMCQPANERTLIGSLLPGGVGGINAVRFVSFVDPNLLLSFASFANSVIADFFIKVKGRSNIHEDDVGQLPLPVGRCIELANSRTLRLSCTTNGFSRFWAFCFDERFKLDGFSNHLINDLDGNTWSELSSNWDGAAFYRNDLVRRQAQLEVDVLVAMELGLRLDELIQVYSVQFPVMKAYEEADQYDTKGRRLPNTTRKDAGAKELREALKNHDGESPVTVSWEIDNGNATVTKTFYPPFKHVDRIEDYKTAYRVFSERLGLTQGI
ncbi:MAG: hypothetical protein VYA55_19250 [Pseudomonadota bacterium]|nr:hypothetical protein [Pseudomonadota bacterium]